MKRPKRILEIGTAVAFSAILMSEYIEEDCIIDTIENYEKRIQRGKGKYPLCREGRRIHLLEGDAMEWMRKAVRALRRYFCRCGKGSVSFLFYRGDTSFEKRRDADLG